jgi:hypothetical protein
MEYNDEPNTDIPTVAFSNIGKGLSDFSETDDLKSVNELLLTQLKECNAQLKRSQQINDGIKQELQFIKQKIGTNSNTLTRSKFSKFTNNNGGTKRRKTNKRRRHKSRIYRR